MYVLPGDKITGEAGYLKGHGTYVQEESIVANVKGVVERVNQLISVKPSRTHYVGDVGDVVVGRVLDVVGRKWKVDVGGAQDAQLSLAAAVLPGAVQRRKTDEDELQMRQIFKENDLILAEIQQLYIDGTIVLHTRNAKYGKLSRGCFVACKSYLIKRSHTTFHSILDMDVILGNNGGVWIPWKEDHPLPREDVLERIARIRFALTFLNQKEFPIHAGAVEEVLKLIQPYAVHQLVHIRRDIEADYRRVLPSV